MQPNPYAAPTQPMPGGPAGWHAGPAGWHAGPAVAYWMEGRELVAYRGATLPPICIHTGEPVQGAPVQKTLRWSPPWVALLILIGWPFALIAALITQKSAPLAFYMSESAKRRRLHGILIATVGSIGSVVVLVGLGIMLDEPIIGLASIVTFLAALLIGVFMSRIPVIVRIDEQTIRLKLPLAASSAFNNG